MTTLARGGYQKPRNPAPVSNPGSLSRRTDGGPAQVTQDMTGLPYGENADFNEMQSSAPLAATPGPAMNSNPSQAGGGTPSTTGLFSPSQRPEEPVTAGVDFGPGMGNQPITPARRLSDVYAEMAAKNPDSELTTMAAIARRMGY